MLVAVADDTVGAQGRRHAFMLLLSRSHMRASARSQASLKSKTTSLRGLGHAEKNSEREPAKYGHNQETDDCSKNAYFHTKEASKVISLFVFVVNPTPSEKFGAQPCLGANHSRSTFCSNHMWVSWPKTSGLKYFAYLTGPSCQGES